MSTDLNPLTTPPSPTSPLLTLTPYSLLQRYPNLPSWAAIAFYVLQQPQQLWTPEARALLNMTYVPPKGYLRNLEEPLSEEQKDLFATSEKMKEDLDLWRLSRDLVKAREEGWEMWKGNAGMSW